MRNEETEKSIERVADKSSYKSLSDLRKEVGQPNQPKFAETLEIMEGDKWIGRLEGNGKREVAIYIPKGVDFSKTVEFIYHFHGVNSDVIKDDPASKTYGLNRFQQNLAGVKEYNKKNKKNAILIYPLSAGYRVSYPNNTAPPSRYDRDWMRAGNNTGDNIGKLHSDTLAVIAEQFGKNPKSVSVTVQGYSAGGRALMNIFDGRSPVKIAKVVFEDASYENWASTAYQNAIRQNPNIEFDVIFKPGTKTDNAHTQSLEGKKGVILRPVTGVSHGKFPKRFFGGME